MIGNIHNVMTDLFDHIGLRENTFSWVYSVTDAVMDVDIRLPASYFPEGIRIPVMVCKLQFSRHTEQEPQVIFLEKNTLFQAAVMNRVLDFLSTHLVEVV